MENLNGAAADGELELNELTPAARVNLSSAVPVMNKLAPVADGNANDGEGVGTASETGFGMSGEGNANLNGVGADVSVPLAGESEEAFSTNAGGDATALKSPEANLNTAGAVGATTLVPLGDGDDPCDSPNFKDDAGKVEGDAGTENGSTDPGGIAIVPVVVTPGIDGVALLAGDAANRSNDVDADLNGNAGAATDGEAPNEGVSVKPTGAV